ncbi:MAG: hypothetical protein ACKVY0_18380 [Prosthecobacter sp.]|uniref:hypothetical protein n=1 Tax=Prosthecobacter sp. TaxID=1965333 RepID=UPI003902B1BA
MYTALHPARFFATVLLACNLAAGQNAARPVVLNKNLPLRSGTELREKREIRVENGRSKQVSAKETTAVSTRYVQRLNLVRRIAGAGTEEIRVAEFLTELMHFTGPVPPPNEQASSLMTKMLRARKSAGRWSYDLVQGKPTPDERQMLDNLAYTAGLLDVLSLCIGSDAHKLGETWKTAIPAPRGKATGFVVPKDISCTFASIEDQPDGTLATIAITGSLSLERPMGYNSHVEITFEAVVVRRLTDMLDVDTKIKGTYTLKGEANLIGIGKAQLDFNYPYTLTRTLKLEPK